MMDTAATANNRLYKECPLQEFILYVAGASAISSRAILNIQQFIQQELHGKAVVQIVDVHQENTDAIDQDLVALPLLVRHQPLPERKFIGDLSDLDRLRLSIGLTHP